jgi:hypothetical protein
LAFALEKLLDMEGRSYPLGFQEVVRFSTIHTGEKKGGRTYFIWLIYAYCYFMNN